MSNRRSYLDEMIYFLYKTGLITSTPMAGRRSKRRGPNKQEKAAARITGPNRERQDLEMVIPVVDSIGGRHITAAPSWMPKRKLLQKFKEDFAGRQNAEVQDMRAVVEGFRRKYSIGCIFIVNSAGGDKKIMEQIETLIDQLGPEMSSVYVPHFAASAAALLSARCGWQLMSPRTLITLHAPQLGVHRLAPAELSILNGYVDMDYHDERMAKIAETMDPAVRVSFMAAVERAKEEYPPRGELSIFGNTWQQCRPQNTTLMPPTIMKAHLTRFLGVQSLHVNKAWRDAKPATPQDSRKTINESHVFKLS